MKDKLKTLKDLSWVDGVETLTDSWLLRQEAIKLIKWYNKRNSKMTTFSFMDFFNITEDDLQ